MPAVDLTLLRDRLAARFRIERALGQGGMGAVYLARELGLDRLVALKVLPPAFADDPALRERFLRETKLAASFAHPNIVPVYAVEEHDDLLAFAMAYVEGETLSDRVRRTGPLTAREAVRLMHDVAYALAYAHGRGVVHRDIKPDNLMLERATSRALLMDFGVARPISNAAPADSARTDELTRVGEVVGTPEYMSPEQAVGDVVDGRSDLYALGLVLWFALTGRTAMGGDSAQRVLVRQLTERLPPLATARPDLPSALCRAVDRCLEKEPDARFPDAGALAQALDDAELAAPEIPIPLRLAASELRTLSVALPLVVLFGLGAVAIKGVDNLDPLTPVVLAFALRTAALMAVIAVASIAGVLSLRTPLPNGGHAVGTLGVALFFNGLACFAVALTLASRDPRRTPLSERLYRLIWLGAPGSALLRFAMRKALPSATASGTISAAHGAPALPIVTPAAAAPPDRSLEARVARLEQRLDAIASRSA